MEWYEDFFKIKNFVFRISKLHSFGLAWMPKPGTKEEDGVIVLVFQVYLMDDVNGVKLISLRDDSENPEKQANETIDMYARLIAHLFDEQVSTVTNETKQELGLVAKPQTRPPSPSDSTSNTEAGASKGEE